MISGGFTVRVTCGLTNLQLTMVSVNVLKFIYYSIPFFMPPPFSVGGHIVSPLSVRTSIPCVRPVHNTFG